MVKKPTLVLLGIFIIVAAFAVWMEESPSILPPSGTATPTNIPNPLVDWNLAGTRVISYKDPAGTTINLRMGEDFTDWDIDEIPGAKADSGKIMQVLSEITSMQPVQKLESQPSDEAMGLGEEAKVITLIDSSDREFEIQMGSETPISSGSYIKAGGNYYIINTPIIDNVTGLLTLDGIIRPTETPELPAGTP